MGIAIRASCPDADLPGPRIRVATGFRPEPPAVGRSREGGWTTGRRRSQYRKPRPSRSKGKAGWLLPGQEEPVHAFHQGGDFLLRPTANVDRREDLDRYGPGMEMPRSTGRTNIPGALDPQGDDRQARPERKVESAFFQRLECSVTTDPPLREYDDGTVSGEPRRQAGERDFGLLPVFPVHHDLTEGQEGPPEDRNPGELPLEHEMEGMGDGDRHREGVRDGSVVGHEHVPLSRVDPFDPAGHDPNPERGEQDPGVGFRKRPEQATLPGQTRLQESRDHERNPEAQGYDGYEDPLEYGRLYRSPGHPTGAPPSSPARGIGSPWPPPRERPRRAGRYLPRTAPEPWRRRFPPGDPPAWSRGSERCPARGREATPTRAGPAGTSGPPRSLRDVSRG